jgi:hypothetical protein
MMAQTIKLSLAQADVLGMRKESVLIYPGEMLEFDPDGYQRFTRAEKDLCHQIGVWLSALQVHQDRMDACKSEFFRLHPWSVRGLSSFHILMRRAAVSWLILCLAWVRFALFRLQLYYVYPGITPTPVNEPFRQPPLGTRASA